MAERDEMVYARYLRDGREDDLRTLLERYRESLTLFARGIVRNLEDAEEVMLDTFAVAASGTARFDGRSSFRTWIFAIARKQAISRLRRRRFRLEPLEDRADETVPSSDFDMLREERNLALYEALAQLPDDYQQVLFLLYFEEMSDEDVARVMRKTPKQVYNLAHRSKKALRDALVRIGLDDADL